MILKLNKYLIKLILFLPVSPAGLHYAVRKPRNRPRLRWRGYMSRLAWKHLGGRQGEGSLTLYKL